MNNMPKAEDLNISELNRNSDYKVYTVKMLNNDVYFMFPELNLIRKKGKKKIYYIDAVMTFDIETTILPYDYDDSQSIYTLAAQYLNETTKPYLHQPFSYMYHWQVCINGYVVIGRTWSEFFLLMSLLRTALQLQDDRRLVIYVHNLAYEFQFIYRFFEWSEIFARAPHKVMKATTTDGFEFRCSYFLSNMSLEKFCENTPSCIHKKAVNDLDYDIVRTADTQLTMQELIYCIHDVLGLYECIKERLQEDTIATIPLTSTGYVRRECREAMNSNPSNHDLIYKSYLKERPYLLCKKAFRGGNTHANRIYAGKIMKNVYSFDITSSYPFVMMTEEYPVGQFLEVKVDSNQTLEKYLSRYLAVMQIELFDLEIKDNVAVPYIDTAHCFERSHIIEDNGRVLYADYIAYTCTSIDFEIINDTYKYSKWSMRKMYISHKQKLPIELRLQIFEYFKQKTELKDVEGKEYEYLKSKNRINATFGMMVTAIDMDDIMFNASDGVWEIKKANVAEQIERSHQSYNTFLLYQWGIFITAYARKRLNQMLNKVGMDTVYTDTDSIKFIGSDNIIHFLRESHKVVMNLKDSDIYYAAENDATIEVLGVWDYEGMYEKFRTWGAKKYAYVKNGKFQTVVSGMNRKKGAKVVASIENFELGRQYENVGRTVSFYNNEGIEHIIVDGCEMMTSTNVGIVPTTYTLGVTDTYAELICNNLIDENSDIVYYNE